MELLGTRIRKIASDDREFAKNYKGADFDVPSASNKPNKITPSCEDLANSNAIAQLEIEDEDEEILLKSI